MIMLKSTVKECVKEMSSDYETVIEKLLALADEPTEILVRDYMKIVKTDFNRCTGICLT